MVRDDVFMLNNAYLNVITEGTADLGPQAEGEAGPSPVIPAVLKTKEHDEECECSDCGSSSTGSEAVDMAKNELYNAVHHAVGIYAKLKMNPEIEAWVASKITKAADYLSSVKHYLDYEDKEMMPATEENEEADLVSALNMGSSDLLSKISTILSKESKENLQKLLYEVVKAIEAKK
jgi:hypothetical protein